MIIQEDIQDWKLFNKLVSKVTKTSKCFASTWLIYFLHLQHFLTRISIPLSLSLSEYVAKLLLHYFLHKFWLCVFFQDSWWSIDEQGKEKAEGRNGNMAKMNKLMRWCLERCDLKPVLLSIRLYQEEYTEKKAKNHFDSFSLFKISSFKNLTYHHHFQTDLWITIGNRIFSVFLSLFLHHSLRNTLLKVKKQ